MPLLGYDDYNFRGREVEDLLNSSNLILEQDIDSTPTLLHKRHLTSSRPDLIIISADIYEQTTVEVKDDIGSDHYPILIKIKRQTKPKAKRKTFWNYRKAKWLEYAKATDEEFEQLDIAQNTIDKSSQDICQAISTAAKKTIPRGSLRKFKPFWNKELDSAVRERQKARKAVEKNPSSNNRINYNKCTARVRLLTNSGKRINWRKT